MSCRSLGGLVFGQVSRRCLIASRSLRAYKMRCGQPIAVTYAGIITQV